MKKSLIYLVLLLALGTGVYFLITRQKDGLTTEDANFTFKDTANIGKIFLGSSNGVNMTLRRTDSGWYINNKFRSLDAPINQLLKTLYKQKADFPVPADQQDMIVRSLVGNSIKVELYDKAGKKISVFYVGNEANEFAGTYMMKEGAKRIFVVNIPVFSGVLFSRYSPDIRDWRDRVVFNTPAEDINYVSVQYDENPANSFVIKKREDQFVITPSGMVAGLPDQERLNDYMNFFTKVYCEGFVNEIPGIDSILSVVPRLGTIDMMDKRGNNQHLSIYFRPINKRSKNIGDTTNNGQNNRFDSDRFFAVFNHNKDTAVIQRMIFDKILRKGSDFYNNPKE